MRWRRVGKKSGPGNLLDDRWQVLGDGGSWWIVDKSTHADHRGPFHTMKAARAEAERIAALVERLRR